MALDPSRGALLAMSIESPDLMERIHQGALVGLHHFGHWCYRFGHCRLALDLPWKE